MEEYWNHNTAYHPWIQRIASARRGDLLDVGCGEGLLMERLAPVSTSVTGIDCDRGVIERAQARLDGLPGMTLICDDFLSYDFCTTCFDLVTMVASLHHMSTRAALLKARDLIRPWGTLVVVDLYRPQSLSDYAIEVGRIIPSHVSGWIHHETRHIGVPVCNPTETLADIRTLSGSIFPGATIRRGLYYRYLLQWTKIPEPCTQG